MKTGNDLGRDSDLLDLTVYSADEGTTVKAGFIFLHDENSTYDLNFINAAKEACEKMGIEYVFKTADW